MMKNHSTRFFYSARPTKSSTAWKKKKVIKNKHNQFLILIQTDLSTYFIEHHVVVADALHDPFAQEFRFSIIGNDLGIKLVRKLN